MLVLSRKIGEKLVIGGNVTVVVSRVNGNRVTLGIEAPPEVRVIRAELDGTSAAETPAPLANSVRDAKHRHARPGYRHTATR